MPQCRPVLNPIFSCFLLIFSLSVLAHCAVLPTLSTNSSSLQQVSFSSPPTAQVPVDVVAVFSFYKDAKSPPSSHDQAGSPLELLLVSADLSVFGRYTASSVEQAAQGSVIASFSKVVFPKGGQYVLVFDGHLPLPSTTSAADGSRQQQAVSAVTFIGVGARPSNSAAARYNGSRAGLKEVVVLGRPLQQQQQSSSLFELLLPDGSGSGTQPTAAAASSNRNRTLQDAYRVTLDMPDRCVPGQLATYTWTLQHASSGEPVTDLQRPGSAALRLVIASADLSHLQLYPGNAQPPAAPGSANGSANGSNGSDGSSSVGGASVYMRGSKVAPDATVAPSAEPVSASDAQEEQQLGGRRLLAVAAAHAPLRQLQQTGSRTASVDSSSSSRAGQGGPSLSAQVALPQYGTYLFVAEVVRGVDELVVMPFYVVCSSGDPHRGPAAGSLPTNGAAAVITLQPLCLLLWAALALLMPQLLL